MKASIVTELNDFFQEFPNLSQNILAAEAEVTPMLLSRLIAGKRTDTASRNADALRGAMERIRQRQSEGVNAPEA